MRGLRRILIVTLMAVMLPAAGYAMPWSWDMFRQISPKPQRDAPPPTPEGIVSIDGKPYYTPDRARSSALRNPHEPTEESIKRGKFMYTTYCATCHGATGKGEGLVGQKYVPPTDLTSDYVQNKSDGELYHIITNGGLGIMPSYGDAMNKTDRWHLVIYIKHQLSEAAPAQEEPSCQGRSG